MVYELRNKDNTISFAEFDLVLTQYSQFKYAENVYSVYEIDKTRIRAKQVDDEYFGNYYIDSKKLSFENELIQFFVSNNISVEGEQINEDFITTAFLKILSPYFTIEQEVWGKHFSGRKMKIDAILTLKSYEGWRNTNVRFGIEFKNPFNFETTGRRDSDKFAQLIDYSFSNFKNYDSLIILMCPILPKFKKEKFFLEFLSRYHVGYIDFSENEISFKIGLQTLWSEKRQVHDLGKRSKLEKKYGNRGYKTPK